MTTIIYKLNNNITTFLRFLHTKKDRITKLLYLEYGDNTHHISGCFAKSDLPGTIVKSKTAVALNKVQECAKICFESTYIGMTKDMVCEKY